MDSVVKKSDASKPQELQIIDGVNLTHDMIDIDFVKNIGKFSLNSETDILLAGYFRTGK